MQSGDIFKIDDEAIKAMEAAEFSVVWKDKAKNEHRLAVGTQFRIANRGLVGLPIEVRASKINPDTGKCSRGRPRRFPAEVCYRLLGEVAPDPNTVQTAPVVVSTVVVQNTQSTQDSSVSNDSAIAQVEQDEQSEEDKQAQEARVAALLGLVDDDATSDDW